jgi:putative oxidoreductase
LSAGGRINCAVGGVYRLLPRYAVPPVAGQENKGERAMAQAEAKLMYPGLAGFYQSMLPVAETLVRVIVGIMFLMHVSVKFKLGADAVAANVFSKNGLEPALIWTYITMFLETVGGICLIAGLFTRFFAAALAIEMLIALLFVHMPKGYAAGGGGYEYVLLIGAICFAFAIRGGGPYSIDRYIGKEL